MRFLDDLIEIQRMAHTSNWLQNKKNMCEMKEVT